MFKQKCICLIAFCFISYYNSLQGDYVFDDLVAIVKNKDVTSSHTTLNTIQEIFKHDFWGYNITDKVSHKSYRPLQTLMFHIEYRIFGLNSSYMKLINLLLHCSNTILVLKLYTKLVSTKELSFIGAILFAIHPIHTEAVCGIVGRAELIFCFFFLISLIIYSNPEFGILSNFKLIPKYIILCGISVIGLFFKENAITILPTCIAFDITIRTNIFQNHKHRFRLRRQIFYRCSILILVTLLLINGRLYIQNYEAPIFKTMDNPIAFCNYTIKRILSQNYLYVLNSWLILCPYWLSFDWALDCIQLINSPWDIRLLTILIFWIIIYCLLLKSSRIVLLATILTIVPFLPASGIIIVGFVIAERVLYVPSIGFALLIAIGFGYLINRFYYVKQLFYIGLIALVLTFILRTRQRSELWKTGESLYKSGLEVCPNNAKVHYNIAIISTDKGDKTMAFEHYHKAIKLYPKYEAALMNLGNLYRDIGDLKSAELYLKKAVDALENFPTAWMNLGIVQALQNKYIEAEKSYKTALSYRDNYSSCLYNMGNLYLNMKNVALAMKYWQESVALNPELSKAWANMLTFLDNNGLSDDVLRISERALKFLPNDTSITFIRANALGKLRKYKEAETLYLYVIDKHPKNALYQSNLGILYHRWNKADLAIERYKTTLRLNPHSKNVRYNLQKLLQNTTK